MATISDFQEDKKPVFDSSASLSSSRSWKKRKYRKLFDPTNPLGFLMKVFEFMTKNCDFLEMDSSEKHIETVLHAVRVSSKKRKVAEEEAKAKAKSMEKEKEEKTEAVTEEAKKTIKIQKDAKKPQSDSGSSTWADDFIPLQTAPAPNEGNGFFWTQTLQGLFVNVPIPPGTNASFVTVEINKDSLKVGLKGQPPIIDGHLSQLLKPDDCYWDIEDQKTVSIMLTKHNQMEWWKSLLKEGPEIDTQKVEPESSKVSDSDPETKEDSEKMMSEIDTQKVEPESIKVAESDPETKEDGEKMTNHSQLYSIA